MKTNTKKPLSFAEQVIESDARMAKLKAESDQRMKKLKAESDQRMAWHGGNWLAWSTIQEAIYQALVRKSELPRDIHREGSGHSSRGEK